MSARAPGGVYKRSCSECARVKRTCSHSVPCERCINMGYPDKCVIPPDARRREARDVLSHADVGNELADVPPAVLEAQQLPQMNATHVAAASFVTLDVTLPPSVKTVATSADVLSVAPVPPSGVLIPRTCTRPAIKTLLSLSEPRARSRLTAGRRKRVRCTEVAMSATTWHPADASVLDQDEDECAVAYQHEGGAVLQRVSTVHTPGTRMLVRHEDAMVRIMHQQYGRDQILSLCVPSIPLGTPLDHLRPLANVRGCVPIEHVLGMLHDDSSLRRKRDVYEAGVLNFLARLPEPNMRFVFWQPEEVNLAGTDVMAPRLLYGNFAWVFMLFLRRMIPAYMIPMDGSRGVSRALLADALRLFVVVGAYVPATVLTRGAGMQPPDVLLSLSDDELLAVYEDGVFVPLERSVVARPTNIVAPSYRAAYFHAVAHRVANRERMTYAHVRLEMSGELLISMRPDIRAPFDVEYVMTELPRVRELVRSRPLVLELLRTLSESTWFVVELDETMSLDFSPIGLLQSVNVTYRNVCFHTVQPHVAARALVYDELLAFDGAVTGTSSSSSRSTLALGATGQDERELLSAAACAAHHDNSGNTSGMMHDDARVTVEASATSTAMTTLCIDIGRSILDNHIAVAAVSP